MLQTTRSFRGMVTTPHHLASSAGQRVLQDGGNAIEAMIAAASTIAVVYPHMNSLGGDNFWLIHEPGGEVIGIDACGAAALGANVEYYENLGFGQIPSRGPSAALTCAGAVSGWDEALKISKEKWGGQIDLARLLEDAIFFAGEGIPVTKTQADNTKKKFSELSEIAGFKETFLINGQLPEEGTKFSQPRLARTLQSLVKHGLKDFYKGRLAKKIADDLDKVGSPLSLEDLERHLARRVQPLSLSVSGHKVFNMPPPTQGLASLLLLGIFDRLGSVAPESSQYLHNLVEATKIAFSVRDKHISDPDYMAVDPKTFLTNESLDQLASFVNPMTASPWPQKSEIGDTVWLGVIDKEGRAVSFIQSIYWEFGSGVVLEETGINWQNRGTSFSLEKGHQNILFPTRRPFHTIQPALALLSDGATMVYGTMGGDGQPQTQAALFSRYAMFDQPLQEAVTAPRWLLGRTWGSEINCLRIENRFDPQIISALQNMGHDVKLIGGFDEVMGHAGALVLKNDGLFEGASDPRSDGSVAAF